MLDIVLCFVHFLLLSSLVCLFLKHCICYEHDFVFGSISLLNIFWISLQATLEDSFLADLDDLSDNEAELVSVPIAYW